MKRYFLITILCLTTTHFTDASITELPMVVFIPSYNNAQWYKKNLNSVFQQNYKNYRVVYVDDCSADNTYTLVEQHIKECCQAHRVTLIRNKTRNCIPQNIYNAVHQLCEDHEIIVNLDGDDWFSHKRVLQRINQEYQKHNTWATYGNYVIIPDEENNYKSIRVDPNVIKKRLRGKYRKVVAGHLRTFYAWLFKKIRTEDFCHEGKFVWSGGDYAYLFPIFEMAEERCRFIPEIVYVQNRFNPLNDFKVCLNEQIFFNQIIRNKPPYKRLENPTDSAQLYCSKYSEKQQKTDKKENLQEINKKEQQKKTIENMISTMGGLSRIDDAVLEMWT